MLFFCYSPPLHEFVAWPIELPRSEDRAGIVWSPDVKRLIIHAGCRKERDKGQKESDDDDANVSAADDDVNDDDKLIGVGKRVGGVMVIVTVMEGRKLDWRARKGIRVGA